MTEGIYIFPSSEDFLKAIEDMIAFENSLSSNFRYLHKHMNSLKETDKECNLLNKCDIMSFNGYITRKVIKVSLSLHSELFNVTYTFKDNSLLIYQRLHHYLQKRQGVYL